MVMQGFVGLVTARGGSKGVSGKNLRVVGGRPLIAWTIEAARHSCLDAVIVSTDSEGIADVAKQAGASVPFMRPAVLAEDSTGHDVVIGHAIKCLWPNGATDTDYIVLLQPTSPLRGAYDIDGAIRLAIERDADCIVSVCSPTHHPALSLKVDEDSRVSLPEWVGADARRQAMGAALMLNGAIYVIRAKAFIERGTYWSESTFAYKMPISRSMDVDTYYDLYLTDLMLQNPFVSSDSGLE